MLRSTKQSGAFLTMSPRGLVRGCRTCKAALNADMSCPKCGPNRVRPTSYPPYCYPASERDTCRECGYQAHAPTCPTVQPKPLPRPYDFPAVYGGAMQPGKTIGAMLGSQPATAQQGIGGVYARALGAQDMQNQWAAQMARYRDACAQHAKAHQEALDIWARRIADDAANSFLTRDHVLSIGRGSADRGEPVDG